VIIERQLAPFLISDDGEIRDALTVIDANRSRMAMVVDAHGLLVGTLTDGDIRRWMMGLETVQLASPVTTAMNRAFVSASIDQPREHVRRLLTDAISCVPLLDERGRLMALAFDKAERMRIGGREIGEDAPAFVIAEIGINHNGDRHRAIDLVEAAAESGADCAKFQMRDLDSLYRRTTSDASEDLGAQYTLDLLNRFELPTETMFELFDLCQRRGLVPLCTPWDDRTVEHLEAYGLPGYKIASADLTNHDLVRLIATTGRPIILSTGMSTEAEIIETVHILRDEGAAFALLHCNSTYPAPYRDVNLAYMDRLHEIAECPVGYSGHERGHHVAVAAAARGANIIEKHITLDRSLEGNDHKVSLLPSEFASMVSEIRDVESAVGATTSRAPTQGELMNRVNLAKSVVAALPITSGDTITEAMLTVKSPGRGLQPNRKALLIGREARRSLAPGDFFYPSDVEDAPPTPRAYQFRRPWGVPVRYHDVTEILERASPDFIEFHFSYKDLELDPADFLEDRYACQIATHSPDLFRGDHILDLAADDDDYRKRSISELQRVIDHTRELAVRFPNTDVPLIIVSMGGFSRHQPIPAGRRPMLYERVAASLQQLDTSGVELIAQTLPPFPWYLGGQLYCNLFVDPDGLVEFCRASATRLCLDVSHSKLAANQRRESFAEWTALLAPHTAHLHLVDAAGIDGEGLQIGDGEIDWATLAEQLDAHCPEAMFIPEIWQGHQNAGEGFWLALERLESWF